MNFGMHPLHPGGNLESKMLQWVGLPFLPHVVSFERLIYGNEPSFRPLLLEAKFINPQGYMILDGNLVTSASTLSLN